MPQFVLKLKADLENIQELVPIAGVQWELDIASTDGVDVKTGITVSKDDVLELEGSKGDANYIMKWPGSKVQAYIKIIDLKGVDGHYKADSSGSWVTVVGLECRNLVVTGWKVGRDFVAVSSAGHVFEEVDLGEGDWAEYDEENDLSVSVMNVETKVE